MRVLLVDIETAPNLGYTWGKYEQDVLKFVKQWEILSFAYRILGTQHVFCLSRQHFKSEKALVKQIWSVLNGADVLIGHNIDGFDNPKLRAKFVEYGLKPPAPYKTVDTLKIARSQFGFTSNKLNDLAVTLKLGHKVHTGGVELWFGCMAGNAEAWAKMIDYNKQDVVLLDRVYEKLRAWYPQHPNFALFDDRPGCPVCSSERVQRRGVQVLKVRKVARYCCQSCGHWFTSSIFDKRAKKAQGK